MTRDFGSGLTYDELVGFYAFEIQGIALPNDAMGRAISKAVTILIEAGFGQYVLAELWGDGHSVWQTVDGKKIVVVGPTGQLSVTQD